MEDIIDIIVTETTNLIEITSQPTDEIIDVNIIDNREDITLNVTPTVVEININSLTGNFGVNWGDIEGTLSNQTDLQTVLNAKADLVDGKVPSSQLPSYVDDVVEVATYSALPVTGETGKIYITLDTNYIYRWTGSTYVEIKDSSAVWGAITGTLSNQTDLQNALNLKANDSLVVHLAGTETITGAKTFSSAVTAPNFVLSGGTGNTGLYYGHTDRVVLANYTTGGIDFEVNGGSIVATLFPSGNYGLGITLDAGYKLDVNGTARISGALSGTSASFSSSVTGASIIKSGGTSSQFLKADGSVDSSTYLTTSSAASTYVSGSGVTDYYARFTGTKVIADGFIRTTSNITYIEGMGLSTGNGLDIQGNYGAGGGGLKIRSYDETTGNAYIDFANTGGRMYLGLNRSTSGGLMTNATAYATVLTTGLGTSNLEFGTNATKRVTIDGTTGAVTLTSALSGTSATFSGAINLTGTANSFQVASIFRNANRVFFGGDTGGYFFQNSGNTATVLQIADSGAATFSSSVTAGGNIAIQSGNSAVFYRPDNAIYTSLYDAGSGAANGFILNNTNGEGFHFKNGATTIMRMPSNGNVGIGTTSPSDKLNVVVGSNGNVARFDGPTSGLIFQTNASTTDIISYGGSTPAYRALNFSTGASTNMTITSSGNVGIGTTSPSGQLHLKGASNLTNFGTQMLQVESSTDNYSGIVFSGTSGSNAAIRSEGASTMTFWTASGTSYTERMRITSSGNVGIGTTSPDSFFSSARNLVVGTGSGNNGMTIFSGSAAVGDIAFADATTDPAFYSGLIRYDHSLDAMRFFTASSERMRITSGGNVYIGTTSATGLERIVAVNSTNNAGYVIQVNGATRTFLYSTGNNNTYFESVTGGIYVLPNQANGVYISPGSTSWSSSSDERMKTDLVPIENATDKISQLRSMIGRYKTDAQDKKRSFLIAQDVLEVLPEAVNLDSNSGMYGVQYTDVIPLLVASIKELKAELDTLKNK